MIVCHCQGINDRELRRRVREGADSPSELARRCGAGVGCGGCRPLIDQILDEECREPIPLRLELAAAP